MRRLPALQLSLDQRVNVLAGIIKPWFGVLNLDVRRIDIGELSAFKLTLQKVPLNSHR